MGFCFQFRFYTYFIQLLSLIITDIFAIIKKRKMDGKAVNYYEEFNFYATDECGKVYELEKFAISNGYRLTLRKENLVGKKEIRALSCFTSAKAGEDGYYIVSRSYRQKGDIQTFFREREDNVYSVTQKVASCCAVKKQNLSCLIRIKRAYRYEFVISVKDGVYSLAILYRFGAITEDTPIINEEVYDDIELEVIFLPVGSDFTQMAKMERQIRLLRGEITTLQEKCQREIVEYSRKYPLVRIRMGWKESPSSVLRQTDENEPPMKVVCTFKRVREIADEMKRQGIEGADVQLVGWNKSGHDGRFPQFFPVDERLGGEVEMRKTIEHIKSLGYKISTHTVFTDAYELANNFSWDDVVRNKNGEVKKVGPFSGGQGYRVCPIKQLENAKRELPKIASLGENGMHYVDVVSLILPDSCYADGHKCNLTDGIIKVNQLAKFVSELFGGFSSEGCIDCLMGNLDFGLYLSFGTEGKEASPLIDEYVPFIEFIYHGVTLYNPISATINFTVKSEESKLNLALLGGRPAFYFYSKFRSDGFNWMGNDDLLAFSDEQLITSVALIKKGVDEYEKWRDKQTLFMEDYFSCDNGVKAVKYSDGTIVAVNFSDEDQMFQDKKIPRKDYIIINA